MTHFSALVLFALCASVVFGIAQRNATPHDPVRDLLLLALHRLRRAAQLAHVPHRPLAAKLPPFSSGNLTPAPCPAATPPRRTRARRCTLPSCRDRWPASWTRHRKRDLVDALPQKVKRRNRQQHARQPAPPIVRMHAHLRHMPALRTYPRPKNQRDQLPGPMRTTCDTARKTLRSRSSAQCSAKTVASHEPTGTGR